MLSLNEPTIEKATFSLPYFNNPIVLSFWALALVHLVIWTLLPTFSNASITEDFIEAVNWGSQFQWGYDKNPWFTAQVAYLGYLLGGKSGIGIFFIQELFILLGWWSIFRLTSLLSTPIYGLIAVLMLEAATTYTIDPERLNDNYILLGLLPLATLLFYKAIEQDKGIYWISGGAVLALATMAKYNAILLGVCFALFMLTSPKRGKYFSSPHLYMAIVVAFIIIFPNLIWLFQHDFITVNYAVVERARFEHYSWIRVVLNNFNFLYKVLFNFVPCIIFMMMALSWKSLGLINKSNLLLTTEKRAFFLWMALGPIVSLFALSLVLNWRLFQEWGTPFMGFWGSLILILWRPQVTERSLKRFLITIFCLMILWTVGYVIAEQHKDKSKPINGNFPAQVVADYVTNLWHEKYGSRLPYVAGDRYVAGYIGLYSKDKPKVWMEWNTKIPGYVEPQDVSRKGAVFVQDATKGHSRKSFYSGRRFPNFVLNKYKNLILMPPIILSPGNGHNSHAVKIIVGILPPEDSNVTITKK